MFYFVHRFICLNRNNLKNKQSAVKAALCYYSQLRFLFTVVAFQVDFFDLLHKRISRVCSCTLVVKCLFAHIIQSIKEVFLVNTVIFNCFLNTDLFFQIFKFCDEVLKYFFVCVSCASCKRPSSAYLASACGYWYCENVPIFVGTSAALYLITSVRITAFATPCGKWWNAPSLWAIEWFTPRTHLQMPYLPYRKRLPSLHELSDRLLRSRMLTEGFQIPF